MKILHLCFFCLIAFSGNSIAQSSAYFDPAQAYNKLLLEKGTGEYKRIGTYKVIGTEYLFGEKNEGNIFGKTEQAKNISISYNTYTQEIEFYQNKNNGIPLVKPCTEIDSFFLYKSENIPVENGLIFINGKHLGTTDNSFYQVVYRGKFYCLYKCYKSALSIVSTNYIQSELRQFDLQYEYYYTVYAETDLKKIKASVSGLKKFLKTEKINSVDITQDDFDTNPEIASIKVFSLANNNHQKK